VSPARQLASLYLRISTKDQTVENQERELRLWAERLGLEVVSVYADTASGARSDRAALAEVLAGAHRRLFDALLIWSLDRLTREGIGVASPGRADPRRGPRRPPAPRRRPPPHGDPALRRRPAPAGVLSPAHQGRRLRDQSAGDPRRQGPQEPGDHAPRFDQSGPWPPTSSACAHSTRPTSVRAPAGWSCPAPWPASI